MKSYNEVKPTAHEIGLWMKEASDAYVQWRMKNTVEDKTFKMMFAHGYYVGKLVAKAQEAENNEVPDNSGG